MVVVTGATGHLGTVLVRQLITRGEEVRYLTRNGVPPGLSDLGAQAVVAGLFDEELLTRTFAGASRVYHSAGRISLLTGDRAALHRVNVDGTRTALAAARRAGVGRFVHVGSIEAFPLEVGENPVTEDLDIEPDRTTMEYGRSKALGMLEVLTAAAEGLDCVVCCPTAFIGPPDYRHSPMGQVVLDVLREKLPATVGGGFDFVDVRDVARGLILAADAGTSGRIYLLSGSYSSVSSLAEMVASAGGVRSPRICVPADLLLPIMPLVETYYRISRRPPRFTRASLRILSLGITVDSSRAQTELGYAARPIEDTVRDTVEWFRENGYV